LHNSSSSITATSGTMSVLGNTIKWQITPLGDGTYTIQSSSNTSLYLAGSSSASTSTIYLTSLSDSSVPNEYRWDISYATGGGCLIQNVNTGKYLYASAGTVSSSSTLGTAGTSTYRQRVWRIADSVSYYGNSSSYTYIELPSGYSFETLYMFAGDTKAPSVKDEYSNVLWRSADNFTFTGYSTSYVTLDSASGEFTASSSTARYSTTITATHKVTGRTSTFTLVVNPKTVSVGVTNAGHDHASALNEISSNLENCGYSSASVNTGAFTISDIDDYLDDDINNVFVSRSHGGIITGGTCLLLNDGDSTGSGVYYRSTGSITTLDLTNMRLIMFIACKTAAGGSTASNLPSVAVDRGAYTSVGFKENVGCSDANNWTMDFFDLMESGVSVHSACVQLAGQSDYSSTGMTSYEVCGYKYTRLN